MDDYQPLSPRSVLSGITWPAIGTNQTRTLLSVLYQLEQSQWWPAERLQAAQLSQLEELTVHAAGNDFYRQRLPRAFRNADHKLSWESWREIPVLSRAELQEAGEKLLCKHAPKEHGEPKPRRTSGSTGMPVLTFGNSVTSMFWTAFTLREEFWHRRNPQARLAAIRFFPRGTAMAPDGLRTRHAGKLIDDIFPTPPSYALNILCSTEEQLKWLQGVDPDCLLSFPSNVEALAELCLEHQVKLPRLREVRTISEPLTPRLRDLAREAWGAPVTDIYSAREVGAIALQCPECEHYHVQSENVLVEILDDKDQPCPPGQSGRVILTSLNNFSSPLIRYDVGDYAVPGTACACGRGLPVLSDVLGRVRNMLVHPDGRKTWPWIRYKAYREIAPVRQVQMRQVGVDHIEVSLVCAGEMNPEIEQRLVESFRSTLDFPHRFTLRYVDAIERSSAGKYEEFLSDIT
jgi:phenylacetate-CoA ligase